MEIVTGNAGDVLYAAVYADNDNHNPRQFYRSPEWAAFFGDPGMVVGEFRLVEDIHAAKFTGMPYELTALLDDAGVPQFDDPTLRVCTFSVNNIQAVLYAQDAFHGVYYDLIEFCSDEHPGPLVRRLDTLSLANMHRTGRNVVAFILSTAPTRIRPKNLIINAPFWGGNSLAYEIEPTIDRFGQPDVVTAWKQATRKGPFEAMTALATYMNFIQRAYQPAPFLDAPPPTLASDR